MTSTVAMDSSDKDSNNGPGKTVKRIRRNTAQDSVYTDSSKIQMGSSSHLAENSQGTSSVGYVGHFLDVLGT
ncbi:hypothetical protein ACO1O0_002289 [Amphichorda felina]